jgi:hypothetical protein
MTKKAMVLESLQKLGLQVNAKSASNYIRRTYKADMPETTFYTLRKELRDEKNKPQLVKTSDVVRVLPSKPTNGVIELVRTAKRLVELLGKEDAKQLIDSL